MEFLVYSARNSLITGPSRRSQWLVHHNQPLPLDSLANTMNTHNIISVYMVTVIITPDATVPLYLRYHTPILSKHPNVHKQTKLVISSQPSSSPCKYPLHYKGLCIFTATQSNQTTLATKSLHCMQWVQTCEKINRNKKMTGKQQHASLNWRVHCLSMSWHQE